MSNLENKNIIVTGASGGIGNSIIKKLSSTKYRVLIGPFNDIKNLNEYPEIICTDLNNNAFSKSYLNLSRGRKDSFLEKGEGFGATYNFLKFPLRIDFIMSSPKINILSYKTHKVNLSDHKPISIIFQNP